MLVSKNICLNKLVNKERKAHFRLTPSKCSLFNRVRKITLLLNTFNHYWTILLVLTWKYHLCYSAPSGNDKQNMRRLLSVNYIICAFLKFAVLFHCWYVCICGHHQFDRNKLSTLQATFEYCNNCLWIAQHPKTQ